MKFEKLGNKIKQIRGISYKPNQISDFPKEEYMPVLKANNITPDGLDDSNLIFISNNNVKEEQIIKQGDILLAASSGSKNIVGKNIYFNKDYYGSFGAFCKLVRPDNTISSEFLAHFFQTNSYKNHIRNSIQGANINNLKNEHIDNLKIPIIPFQTQLHIANILSKAENLIAQRKESIRLLDEYLKSVFLEMFGDPISNIKNWQILTIKEIGESRLGKMLDKKKIIGNNLKPYLRNSNVLWFDFKLDDLLEMDFDDKDKIEFSLKHGDVLMCEGGEIGRCAIWKNELKECYFQKAIHRIRLNNQIALPEFFVYMFWQYTINGGLNKYIGTATISHLTGEKLKQLKLPIPPIELQIQFAQIVEKTEALKAQYQQSLQELENLYSSLSQKAFKGELSIKNENLLLAAEPETNYTLKPDLKEKDCTQPERAILAAYILNFYAKQNIGRVHLMKLLHLTEYHCQINIHSNFIQEAAGPYDNGLIKDIEQFFIKYKLYSVTQDNTEKRKVHYSTISPNSAISELFYDNFQDEALRINQLLEKFKNWSMVDCEVASTLYAVWNNRILSHQPVDYSAIKQDFLKWSPRKKSIINKFDSVYNWMCENKVIPVGYGGIILKVA